MTHQKPTAILIVHGAYFLPPAWDDFSARLTGAGFAVSCPRLPSCKDERPPTATLTEDVMAVRHAMPRKSFSTQAINSQGVVNLILLSAWLVQPGDSLPGVIGKHGFQCDVDLGNNGDGTVYAQHAPLSFYNDVESARAEELAKGNITHNWAAASGVITGAPWKDLPTVYIYSIQDVAIKLLLQKSMVQDAVDAGAKLTTETINSGHCSFSSRVEELVQMVQKVASEI
ncbi:hypothetical protein ASPCADRAFT_135149 [Aspergillus carbonarius ITEM 5010]|uniref:AB hydrolase-1 domain-containing protein n=1 Tax=Aspergillus carbonarius (strain ITEM 5010) TaxID=602072 RepID=A0A1R3R7K2_ASPC5|nr:hypothetical protein ASPCADRAFT_135149 [Aspergillus carbonarius ITEM 5010]